MVNCNLNTTKALDSNWITSIDSEGYKIETLNMTDEEIIEMQINELKQKYEKARTDEYVYTYTFIENKFDSYSAIDEDSEVLKLILIGSKLSWTQRDSYNFSLSVSFGATAAYKAITGNTAISMNVGQTVKFKSTLDSKLGLFARVKTNRYKVTVSTKYSGTVVSTYYENMLLLTEKTYRPIYKSLDNKIVYYYGEEQYQAKILKPSLTSAPTKKSDVINATTSNF